MAKIIISLFILGFSFGLGPCLASCGPILIAYTAGNKKNILSALIAYVLFSLAKISVYLILGLLVFSSGKFILERLANFSRYIILAGGGFIILLGMLMAFGKEWKLGFCQFLHRNLLEQDKKSIFAIGLIMGLLPCVPLLTLLSYIGLISKSWQDSILYSLTFGLGTALSPLILLVVLSGAISRLFTGKKQLYSQIFRLLCGLIIIFLGLQLIRRAF